MELVKEIEIYRVATLVGIYSKEELIKYLDMLIFELDEVPAEVIEASILSKHNINDISDKLMEITSKINSKDYIVKELLHIIYKRYYLKQINLDDAIYYLYKMKNEMQLSEELINEIEYLSDGIFLAEQDIYEDIEETKKWLAPRFSKASTFFSHTKVF